MEMAPFLQMKKIEAKRGISCENGSSESWNECLKIKQGFSKEGTFHHTGHFSVFAGFHFSL